MSYPNSAFRGDDIDLELKNQSSVCRTMRNEVTNSKTKQADVISLFKDIEDNLVNTETDNPNDTIDPMVLRGVRTHLAKDEENKQRTLGFLISKLCDGDPPEVGPRQ